MMNTPLMIAYRTAVLALCIFGSVLSVHADGTGTINVLHSFNGSDGSSALQGLFRASDGNFYGFTFAGGINDNGVIYKVTPDGQFSTFHVFQDSVAEGSSPAALIQGKDGNLYGVARGGGEAPVGSHGGTFFRLTLSGTFTKLHDFDSGDGTPPAFLYALVQGSDENFYGLSRDGGSTNLNEGTFFRISPDGNTVTELFAFHSGNGPGFSPQAQLLVGKDGNFYGLTSSGGATGGAGASGTIFMATQAGAVTPLHVFTGSTAPRNHTYPLMQGTDGNLYGVSANGGQHDFGTIYRYNLSDGSFTVLHEFQDPTIDGSSPFCTLVQGNDGISMDLPARASRPIRPVLILAMAVTSNLHLAAVSLPSPRPMARTTARLIPMAILSS